MTDLTERKAHDELFPLATGKIILAILLKPSRCAMKAGTAIEDNEVLERSLRRNLLFQPTDSVLAQVRELLQRRSLAD